MPFLSLVHLTELRCPHCDELVAPPGARSVIVNGEGFPVDFSFEDPPAEMTVELTCPQGHAVTMFVPNEISAEETMMTPDEAPLAPDARLRSGSTESSEAL